MKKLAEAICANVQWNANEIGRYTLARMVAEEAGLAEEHGFVVTALSTGPPTFHLYPRDGENPSDALHRLLPHVGKFTKTYDENNDHFSYVGTARDSRFHLHLHVKRPSTCTVEVETYQKLVPEHYEERKRYKLTGDCDPVFATEAA